MSIENGMFINYMLSTLLKRIIVPEDYHDQVQAIKGLLKDDVTGLIDSLTDFAVQSASVDYNIETGNENLNNILKNWLDKINIDYNGRIPLGIKSLASEYFKERWKASSFPVLRIAKWDTVKGGIIVPSRMFFLDGESITAKDKDEKNDNLTLFSYDYYLGDESKEANKLGKSEIFARPYGRWFDKYPTPYLIKRGIYHNYRIIKSLKENQSKILDQIIPYLLLIKKGTEGLATQNIKSYSNTELQQVVDDMKALMDDVKSTTAGDKAIKAPIRVTNFDEEMKHLIPDIKSMFDSGLFEQAERNILGGLGFVDIVQGISNTRRESVLNPKAFVEEVKSAVEDFKNHILIPLIYKIQEKNKVNRKYMSEEVIVTNSPVRGFMTEQFKQEIRLLWKHGQISNRTYCELVGETAYQTEIMRREKELKEGIDLTMYPHLTDNKEGTGIDIPGKETDKNGTPTNRDKIDNKDKFDVSKTKELEGAPYQKLSQLPDYIKKLDKKTQKKWKKTFNKAYAYKLGQTGDHKQAEIYAFRVANSQIK